MDWGPKEAHESKVQLVIMAGKDFEGWDKGSCLWILQEKILVGFGSEEAHQHMTDRFMHEVTTSKDSN